VLQTAVLGHFCRCWSLYGQLLLYAYHVKLRKAYVKLVITRKATTKDAPCYLNMLEGVACVGFAVANTVASLPLMPWLSTVIPFWLKPKAKPVGITTLVDSVRCLTSRIGPHPVFRQSHIPFSAKVRILKMDSPKVRPHRPKELICTHIYTYIYT